MNTSKRRAGEGACRSTRSLRGRTATFLSLGTILLGLGSCSTYESGTFLPRREVHELRVSADSTTRVVAEVDASIVGVMRAADGAGPRVHARLTVENPSDRPLSLLGGRSRLTPGSVLSLAPEGASSSVEIAPGDTRTVELFFPLPDRQTLPRAALSELELAWVLDVGGKEHESRATFQRASRARYASSRWYGPGWYDPYWHHHYHHGPSIGFTYGYCR